MTFFSRLRGLLGRTPDRDLLLLAPCKAIHTFGMRAPIDVAFIDGSGLVMSVYRHFAPLKRARCAGAIAVLERFASTEPFVFEGQRLTIQTIDQ